MRGPEGRKERRVLRSWSVGPADDGKRLDAFVRQVLPHLSIREARRGIDAEAFWIRSRAGKKGDRLHAGDIVSLEDREYLLAASPLPEARLRVTVLYEDDSVLALDKPAGMAAHGFSGRSTRTLANFLVARYPFLGDVGKSRWEPGLVNRLDRETSGIVLVAKEQEAFEKLRAQFRAGLVTKQYVGLVWGRTDSEGAISLRLAHDPKNRKKMRVLTGEGRPSAAKGWKASTRYRRIGESEAFSLLEIEIETGVMHQIRAHLAAIGHPLLGDLLYGPDREDPVGLGRHFLHARLLEFRHPRSGKLCSVKSPLPSELRNALEQVGIDPRRAKDIIGS